VRAEIGRVRRRCEQRKMKLITWSIIRTPNCRSGPPYRRPPRQYAIRIQGSCWCGNSGDPQCCTSCYDAFAWSSVHLQRWFYH
jgi:hypothetical protein